MNQKENSFTSHLSKYGSNVLLGTDENIEYMQKRNVELKCGIIFFSNINFVITKYKPLNNHVHFILEYTDGTELHFKDALCGYLGAGTNKTVKILEKVGLLNDELEMMVYRKDAIYFTVKNQKIIYPKYDFEPFCIPKIRKSIIEDLGQSSELYIEEDKYIFVDFNNSYVRMYNPQKHNLAGFLKLLISMKPKKILFYLGDNSPLENYYREPEKHSYIYNDYKRRILNGAKEVNLVIYGKLYKLCCLVNKDEILDLVNIISLAINKEEIYFSPKYECLKREGNIIKDIKNRKKIKNLKNEVLVLDIRNDRIY